MLVCLQAADVRLTAGCRTRRQGTSQSHQDCSTPGLLVLAQPEMAGLPGREPALGNRTCQLHHAHGTSANSLAQTTSLGKRESYREPVVWLQQAPILHEAHHDVAAGVHGHPVAQGCAVGAILALQACSRSTPRPMINILLAALNRSRGARPLGGHPADHKCMEDKSGRTSLSACPSAHAANRSAWLHAR